jgi:hypothetical protein
MQMNTDYILISGDHGEVRTIDMATDIRPAIVVRNVRCTTSPDSWGDFKFLDYCAELALVLTVRHDSGERVHVWSAATGKRVRTLRHTDDEYDRVISTAVHGHMYVRCRVLTTHLQTCHRLHTIQSARVRFAHW